MKDSKKNEKLSKERLKIITNKYGNKSNNNSDNEYEYTNARSSVAQTSSFVNNNNNYNNNSNNYEYSENKTYPTYESKASLNNDGENTYLTEIADSDCMCFYIYNLYWT